MSAVLLRWLGGLATIELGQRLEALSDELGIGYVRMHLRRQRTRWGSCSSNVSVVEEMVNLIAGQRAYEINSRAIRTADEMMQTANNLVRL